MRQTWPANTEDSIREFVEQILHGDEKHRLWLIRAGEEFIYVGKVTRKDDRAD